jgi:hypothetical protein
VVCGSNCLSITDPNAPILTVPFPLPIQSPGVSGAWIGSGKEAAKIRASGFVKNKTVAPTAAARAQLQHSVISSDIHLLEAVVANGIA